MKKMKLTEAQKKQRRREGNIRRHAYAKGWLAGNDYGKGQADDFGKLWAMHNATADRLRIVEAGNAPEAPSLWEKIHGVIPDPVEGARI